MAEMDKYNHSHFISANINALISFPSETAVREDLTQKVNLSLFRLSLRVRSEGQVVFTNLCGKCNSFVEKLFNF